MQEKLLKQILPDLAGPGAEKVVDLLFGKKNVNEFLIAKKLELTINQTRNMLYKLADQGLVRFVRKKDKKKGGWYTYFWTLKVKRSLELYQEQLEHEVNRLQNQINNRQAGRYYFCVNCHIEFNEENAMLAEYTCPECGEVLELKDNSEFIEMVKQEIGKHEKTLEHIKEELVKIEEKEAKSLERRLKAEAKKKAEERAARKAERDRLKAKEAKASGKTVKKKATKKKTTKKKAKKKTVTKKKATKKKAVTKKRK